MRLIHVETLYTCRAMQRAITTLMGVCRCICKMYIYIYSYIDDIYEHTYIYIYNMYKHGTILCLGNSLKSANDYSGIFMNILYPLPRLGK